LVTTEAKVEKIPWIPIVLLSIVLGLISAPYGFVLSGGLQQFYSMGVVACAIGLGSTQFILLWITALLAKTGILKNKINLTNLTYLYIVGSTVSWYALGTGAIGQAFGFIWGTRNYNPEWAAQYIPSFIAPSTETVRALWQGTGAANWGEVYVPTVYWYIFYVSFSLFLVSLATLFRKDWIEMERIPFPQATAASEIMTRIPPLTERMPSKYITPFGIGLILGAIFQFPILMTYFFPWFPDIFAWRTDTCGHGAYLMPTTSPLMAIVGITNTDKHPLVLAMMYFAPLNILFNIWFWYFIYLVLMQVAYVMGYYTGLMTENGCCRTWGPESVRFSPPFKWEAFSTGSWMALSISYLILGRRFIIDSLKAAFGMLSPDRVAQLEKDEPTSYRTTWLLLIGSTIVMTALSMSAGMDLAAGLVMPLTILLFWIGNARIWGMTGTYIRSAEHGNALYRLLIWPTSPVPESQMAGYYFAAYISEFHIDAPENQNGGAILAAFSSYRVANLTGVSNRSVFKVLLATQLIVPICAMLGYYYMIGTFGDVRSGYQSLSSNSYIERCGNPDNWNRIPGTEPWVPNFAIGFLACLVINFVHARFVWFPFEPIGFTMAFSDACLFFGIWSMALVAWVLKTLTLRIGGSKAYQQFGVPLAGGFLAGYMLVVFIGGLMGIVRFFVPF
jgi:hypothetical protein